MSFNIKFQNNVSEPNKLDKQIVDIITLTGTLKDSTSIIDPVIMIEGDISSFKNANYMTIDAFGRSYFITNIRSIRNNLIEISAHVDVLSTYKAQIRTNTAIIKRNANDWNLYIDDGIFKSYQQQRVATKIFPHKFDTFEYVLSVAGS